RGSDANLTDGRPGRKPQEGREVLPHFREKKATHPVPDEPGRAGKGVARRDDGVARHARDRGDLCACGRPRHSPSSRPRRRRVTRMNALTSLWKANRRAGHPRQSRCRPWLEALEDRLAPASTITLIKGASGTGSLDAVLTSSHGTVLASDGGNNPGTLSS